MNTLGATGAELQRMLIADTDCTMQDYIHNYIATSFSFKFSWPLPKTHSKNLRAKMIIPYP
jgi:hypothetical protein